MLFSFILFAPFHFSSYIYSMDYVLSFRKSFQPTFLIPLFLWTLLTSSCHVALSTFSWSSLLSSLNHPSSQPSVYRLSSSISPLPSFQQPYIPPLILTSSSPSEYPLSLSHPSIYPPSHLLPNRRFFFIFSFCLTRHPPTSFTHYLPCLPNFPLPSSSPSHTLGSACII